jgi:hypothetical protein
MRHERRGGARKGGQAHAGGGCRRELGQLSLRLVEAVDDGVGVAEDG